MVFCSKSRFGEKATATRPASKSSITTFRRAPPYIRQSCSYLSNSAVRLRLLVLFPKGDFWTIAKIGHVSDSSAAF